MKTLIARITLAAGAAATLALPAVFAAGSAGAATLICTRSNVNVHCVGIESHQAVRLQLTGHGAGNVVTAETPAFRKAQDWQIGGPTGQIQWAPRGVRSGLCLTAVSDVPGSDVRLLQCQSGTAGSSHQLWRRTVNGDTGFNFRNLANRLVLAVHGDVSGAPVQVRTDHVNWASRIFSLPGHTPFVAP